MLANYKHILAALEEASATFGNNTAARANNIHGLLSSAKCVLGLVACLPIIEILESLNTALQGTGTTVAGMLAAATVIKDNLLRIREESDKEFHVIFEAATVRITDLQLDALSIPRKRKIPRRLDDGDGAAHAHTMVDDFYRVQYVSALDSAVANLVTYFCSTDIAGYQQLAAMLTTGVVDDAIVAQYPELSPSLQHELTFFCRQYDHASVDGVRITFRDMVPEVRALFPQVATLLRLLLLLSPASACTAERSFSALRRMKTWLRSTMTQQRLNHIMVCHVHRTRLAA